MYKHEQKTCPRCHTVFECKTGSIELCQCQTVILDEAQLDYIHARYDDCLCAACLAELRSESNIQVFQARLSTLLAR